MMGWPAGLAGESGPSGASLEADAVESPEAALMPVVQVYRGNSQKAVGVSNPMKTVACRRVGGGWRWSLGWAGTVGLCWAGTSALGGSLIRIETDLGTTIGVMTNQKWWAGYGNAGLLQLGSSTYSWGEPQFGYGDAGFNWSDGPAVFISNGTENFTHAWSAGDAVIQNVGVVKLLLGEPDGLLLMMDLSLSRGLQAPSSATGGWLTIQPDYYGPELWSGPIELEGGPFRMNDYQLNSPGCVITIYGNPNTPYLGIDLVVSMVTGDGASVPEPAGVSVAVGATLVGWGVWRRRVAGRGLKR